MRKTVLLRFILVAFCVAGLAAVSVANAAKAPLVLTMFSEDVNPNDTGWTDPVAQEITRRTGIKLKIEYPVGDIKQKKTLMLASGDYPDLIFQKDPGFWVDAKVFVDLTPYINKYGKNVKNLYGPYLKRLRYSLKDQSIYFLGCYGVGSQVMEPISGVQLQHAVVKELGFPKMKTVKDLENAIARYKAKHPTIDGQPTIGLSLLADDWRFLISVTNQAVFATGGPDDGEWYVDPKTKKAVLHHTRPEEKEYFRWLNHMNDIGLLDPESFVQKYDQYQAKIASGRVLALTDAW
ncbi:MAG: extracellular solute-binding protein, partial [Bacteroidota bacterium]